MVLNMREYSSMIKDLDISIIYSGPLWDDGIKGIAEMVRKHLAYEELPGGTAKSIFSVFIEQVTNVLMYSAEKEKYAIHGKEEVEVPTGMLVLGQKGKKFFIQTGNVISRESIPLIEGRINHLNSLDKQGLRALHKRQLTHGDDNPGSKGAGLGLIEIARRSTAPLKYTFEPIDGNSMYFTLYVEIDQEKEEER